MRDLIVLLAGTLILAGCATAPTVVREPGEAAVWLGGEPRVVARLDARAVQAWKAVTSKRDALKTVGERTRVVWLGFELNHLDDLKTAADTVKVVLEGDFPRGAAGFMLDWNSAWKKSTPPGVWTNAPLGLSVSLPEEGLVAVARGGAPPSTPATGVLRDLDPLEVEGAAVWLSFWNPGEALFGPTGAKLVPLDRLDVVLSADHDRLIGPALLHFADERAARAATVLLKLTAAQIKARWGQELTWTVEGNVVTGSTLSFAQKDLEALASQLLTDPTPEVKR